VNAKYAVALGCGTLFGLGLAVSQMANPAKVIGFLDVTGDWDPSLLVVLASALVAVTIGFRLTSRRARPLFETSFEEVHPERIDRSLFIGAALFGIGWGIAGYCPGPGVVGLARLAPDAAIFVACFLAGSWFLRFVIELEMRSRSSIVSPQAEISTAQLSTPSYSRCSSPLPANPARDES
jgi:hypothetical protein